MKILATLSLTCLMTTVVTGCATPLPVLYPNERLRADGPAQAERAIDDCIELAQSYGAGPGQPGGDVARRTAENGAVGAASGAAVGAVLGDAGTGAAAGAAGGVSRGLIGALFDSNEADPVFRNFVDRCLREQGYEPIGWE
ncbi:MAG: glycine zipper family protein [Gammaproteobacteria bacterium]